MERLRRKIDILNLKILRLFEARLCLVHDIIKIKQKRGVGVLNRAREEYILRMVRASSCKELQSYVLLLFCNILNISKLMQYEKIYSNFIYKLKQDVIVSGLKFGNANSLINGGKFVLVKSSSLYRFLARFCGHIYVCGLLRRKGCVYYCLSGSIHFERGFNIVLIKLKLDNINELYSYFFEVLTLKKIKILKFSVLERNVRFVELFLHCFGYFKNLQYFLNFIKCLACEDLNLRLYGCFKLRAVWYILKFIEMLWGIWV